MTIENYIMERSQMKRKALFSSFIITAILFLLYFTLFKSLHTNSFFRFLIVLVIFFITAMVYVSNYTKSMIRYFNLLINELILENRDAQAFNEILRYAYENRKRYEYAPINYYLIGLMQSFDKETIKQVVEKEKKHLKSNDFRMQITFHLMDNDEKKEEAPSYYNRIMMKDMSEDARLFHQIQLKFFTQNYVEALNLLKDYTTISLYDEVYKNYYSGLSYYYLNEYEKATPYFNQVIKFGNTLGVVKVVKDLIKEMS